MSGIIPKEKLASYQRWHLHSFDLQPAPSTPPPPPVEAPAVVVSEQVPELELPTPEDIARLQEEARTAGYAAGFEEGKAAGELAGRKAAQVETERITALVGNIEKSLGELDQTVANQILDLALEVAAQITRGAIKAQSDFLLPIIKEAVASLPLHHAHVALHLNPSDAANVRENLGEQLGQNGLQIFENTEIAAGGCRLTAGTSEVDASIETRWNRVLEAIGAEPRAWLNQT